jgi:orotate phosphoribosyltransferase
MSDERIERLKTLLKERAVQFGEPGEFRLAGGGTTDVGAMLDHTGRQGIDLAGFLVRKEPKGHGTKKSVEGPRPTKETPRVVLVEDTFTTGGSTIKAIHRVREEWGAEVVGAFAIVDRGEGAAANFGNEGVPHGALVTLAELRA